MKELEHPRIVNLIEVIDDPDCDHFYMGMGKAAPKFQTALCVSIFLTYGLLRLSYTVLEYVEGRRVFEGSGPLGGIGEANARKYIRDVAEGLIYLHKKVSQLVSCLLCYILPSIY